jgi:hypothetical protein
MHIVLPGGSGQIGQLLARAFIRDGHTCTVLSRNPGASSPKLRHVYWDARTLGPWTDALETADVVINLAGRTVNCRYTAANLDAMLRSRVDSTRILGEAIGRAKNPPRAWLQSSTATIYAHRHDAPNDEATGLIGGHEPDAPKSWRRSIDVALAWEATQAAALTPKTRKVVLRSAVVLSPDRGGILDVIATLTSRGLGGTQGDGRQFLSWIHDYDFVAAINFLIAREDLAGPINLSSPQPIPNREFFIELRRALGIRLALPASRWMLEIGAIFMRTETEIALKSRRVVPGRLLSAGFNFTLPDWPSAARDLAARWR